MTTTRYRCRDCGREFPAWLPAAQGLIWQAPTAQHPLTPYPASIPDRSAS
jgi:hypothetical protein